MKDTTSSHDSESTESCSDSEGKQGQTGTGSDSGVQYSTGNMQNDAISNNGQGALHGASQNITQQQPQMMPSADQTGGTQAKGESGSQNAYDIPRYMSEGLVLGKPQEQNNPQSAGNIQGDVHVPLTASGFQGINSGVSQQLEPQMQQPQMQQPQMQQPQMQQPQMQQPQMQQPQMQQPQIQQPQMQQPQVQQPQMQQPQMQQPQMQQPQMQQPQVPLQGMYAQVTPNIQPQNVYQQNPYYRQDVPQYIYEQQTPVPEEQLPGVGEKRHGQIMDVVNDIINGESPDIPKIMNLFEGIDTQYWKGAIIGALLVFFATNDTVKKTLGDALSGIMGKSSKTENEKGENNV